jgi:uncharacterized protein YndB with AHSA1/START domain
MPSCCGVWRALADHQQFGAWFRVKLEGPFAPGKVVRGQVTSPGYEHVKWEMVVVEMVPERLFTFRWHPNAVDAAVDYSTEPQTLVEFQLEETAGGRRSEALRMNEGGWTEQLRNIERHVRETP